MTQPNERSDPVDGFTDVTPEQLDALHTTCSDWTCKGPQRARERAKLDRAVTSSVDSLGRITAALNDVAETARQWTQRMQGRNPWGHAEIAREQSEELADWERELLAERAIHLENLQAGLQHQRIVSDFSF